MEPPALDADAAFEDFVRARSGHLLRLALLLTGWDATARGPRGRSRPRT